MPISTDNIAKLISFGANAVIEAEGRSVDNVAHLVSIAVEKGATLTIRDAGTMSTDDLLRIAGLGGNRLVLDLT